MNKNKNLAFTLAEVLIVIGIIGVVAALTLPNLNHATGDKETVTRVKKVYSMLSEANDRAIAIYGPITSWSENCRDRLVNECWLERISEFLKTSSICARSPYYRGNADYPACPENSPFYSAITLILNDGTTITSDGGSSDCTDYNSDNPSDEYYLNDICIEDIWVDINGFNKGKNSSLHDIFSFKLSDSKGVIPALYLSTLDASLSYLFSNLETVNSNPGQYTDQSTASFWVINYENLDYLKADENGQCNDSNIILDGVTNTSCH